MSKKSSEAEIREGLPKVFPRLWRYALVLTGNRDSANDLAQSVCLRALEKHKTYQTGTHLDRWLFRIAHRVWLNELRSKAVRHGNGLQPIESTELGDTRPDSETNFFAQQVLNSILTLPEAQRVCVILVYVEGFKYAEAAEILSIPIGTVMSRLASARKTISAQMGKNGETRDD
ncbi:ECF subfamily RNA polymerase sigma factor [Roseibium sp. TrichSKD4]|uniref:RNA polymerase sigma factor n=1 Tax=Roseibium sp. TrichSKD4 TaxID=744980 RepID=UPI0001E56E4F|nr:RNA polymerase sigma factor [Roseibium sp. TrichSKD4]EFO30321.1 ECF subfamily RNA polymerase sigma factor [Roseibium sp. TrichSKD4]